MSGTDDLRLRIDIDRLLERLGALAEIGPIDGGGSSRLALTDDDRAGRDLVVTWMHDLGLEVSIDGIGNVVGCARGRRRRRAGDDGLATSTPSAPAVATTATSACSPGSR